MSTQEHRAPHRPCRRETRDCLALALVCLALAFHHTCCDGNVHNGRTHPDDMAVYVRFRAPHVVAGRVTELDITVGGLVQGVTYKMLVLVARAGDFIHQNETSITWSREMSAQGAAHWFQHTLPPLSAGPHTLRVTVLDAAGVSEEEGLLASMVQRLEAREDRAAGARCAGNTPRHLRAGGREVEAQDESRADTTHTPGDLTVDSMDYAALKTFEYIHIPKTGGVSTSIFGNRFGVKWGTFVYSEKLEVEHTSSFTHSSGQTSSCSTWHIPPKWMPTAGSMKRFAFIRDPIQRAVSEARYLGMPCDSIQIDAYIREELASGSYARRDCHWIPQHDFVTLRNGSLDVQTVTFCFEDLALTMSRIFNTSFDVHVQHVPTRPVQNVDDVQESARPCTVALSASTNSLIREKFKKDFELRRHLNCTTSEDLDRTIESFTQPTTAHLERSSSVPQAQPEIGAQASAGSAALAKWRHAIRQKIQR